MRTKLLTKKNNNMLKDVIVMSKGTRLAVFPTLSKAFEAENWPDYDKQRTKAMPYYRDGIKVQKVPTGVSISSFELLETVSSKKASVSSGKMGSIYEVSVTSYNKEYLLRVEYDTKHEPADYHHGDRGREEISPAYDYDTPTGITSAVEITEDGDKQIRLDKWTEAQIMNYINLEE